MLLHQLKTFVIRKQLFMTSRRIVDINERIALCVFCDTTALLHRYTEKKEN